MITWNNSTAPTGGDWNNKNNWIGDSVPGPNDIAVIEALMSPGIVTLNANQTDTIGGLTTDPTTTLEVNAGTLALSAGSVSTLGGPVTVGSGASLTVGEGASVQIAAGQTLTDNGILNFASGDSVALNGTTGGFGGGPGPALIAVATNGTGTLDASGTNFTTNGVGNFTVGAGGQLTAAGSTFTLSSLSLDDSSVYGSGDLSGDTFNMLIYVPYGDVQYLGGSLKFEQIEINSGTVSSGTLALNLIGTNTSELSYVLYQGITIASGATLAVGPNVPVVISAGETLTDNGTVSFASGDSVALNGTTGGFGGGPGPALIAVGTSGTGTLSASGTNFTTNGVGNFTVGAGGHLTAADSTFTLSSLSLDDSSVYGSCDLSGDTFNMPIYVPYGDVQYLGGSLKFEQIEINSGTVSSGTLALNLIGTNTSDLSYVLYQGITIASGATLAVGPSVPVVIPAGEALTDDGMVTFAAGDSVALNGTTGGFGGGPGPALIAVGASGTGTLNASDTNFTTNGVGNFTVGAGGHLTAADSTFTLSSLSLDDSSVYGSGDLSGDTFNVPIYVPYGDVQYLSGNVSFEQIEINSGTVSRGTLALNLIGTSTSELSYVLYQGITIASGATLAVGPSVPVVIPAAEALTDDGTVTFATGDSVALNGTTGGFGGGPGPALIAVGSSGALSAIGTSFTTNGVGNLIVAGNLTASGSTFAISSVTLNSGSNDTLSAVAIGTPSTATTLTINSGAVISISGNNFSYLPTQGVMAAGDPNATIDLEYNYWGTTVPAEIEAKILDHSTNPNLPTIGFSPYVSDTSGTVANPASATFNPSDQSIPLSATVTDSAGTIVNEGYGRVEMWRGGLGLHSRGWLFRLPVP